MRIAVVGLGKIGLPLAVQYASKHNVVVGIDTSDATVASVNAAQTPFPGEKGLPERVADVVGSGRLRASTDYAEGVPTAEVVVVVVPLLVDESTGDPDFTYIDSATESIGRNLTPGTLIVYETTLPVGTTRQRWKPMLELYSGLLESRDFHLAFSPERVLTGRVFDDLRRYPKLIGALGESGAKLASAFYEDVLDFDDRPDLTRPNGVWNLGSTEAAEMAKLAETTYRDVNIALANQFARFAMGAGIDIHDVIDASNSQPYSHIHRPGIAVGGHCIPVYPRLYLWADPDALVVRVARETNEAMPEYAVHLLETAYGRLEGATVVILGASYRGGVKETAFSGVFPTRDALRARKAQVVVHDPMYSDDELRSLGLDPYHYGEPVDAAVIQADHDEYRSLSPSLLAGVKVVVDGRRISEPEAWKDVAHLTI